MRKTISKLLCMVTVLAVVLSIMPAAMAAKVTYTQRLPRVTVHLLGDSTVTSYAKNEATGITGWGQALEALLNNYVTVNNWAISGLSTKGLLENLGENSEAAYAEQWTTILKNIDAGDYVFIQFGHNDQNDTASWYSTIDQYKVNLTKIVNETKAKGATPVLVTPPERMYYATYNEETGAFTYENTFGGYVEAMKAVVTDTSTAFIDLNAYSKEVIEGMADVAELEAFYAKKSESGTYVPDTSHFSPDGALTLAKYIAGQLETATPSLADYLKANYNDITKNDISYGETMLRMNFENATTETKDENGGTSITGEYRGGKAFNTKYVAKDQYGINIYTAAYEEQNGNMALQFKSDKNRNKHTYYYFSSENMTNPLMCYDFSIKLPGGKKTSGRFVTASDQSYTVEIALEFYSDAAGNVEIKVPCGDRTLTFGKIAGLNYGDWNKVRFIMNQANREFHLIVNEKLVCTDIPYYSYSREYTVNTRSFYVGVASAITGNEVYFDDIFVKSISEKQAAKMLLEGADEYLRDKVLVSSPTAKDGYIDKDLYIPANAALSGTTKAFVWGDYGISRDVYVRDSALLTEGTDFSTSEAPYYTLSRVHAAQGYNGGDSRIQFNPVISIGDTTNVAGEFVTESYTVQRKLMLDNDENLEISVPKIIGQAAYITPQGGNNGWSTLYSGIGTDVSSQIKVKNIGKEDRKVIVGLCFYEDGMLAEVSLPVIETIVAGGEVTYDRNTPKTNLSENMIAKFLVLDAETLKPVMNAITIE